MCSGSYGSSVGVEGCSRERWNRLGGTPMFPVPLVRFKIIFIAVASNRVIRFADLLIVISRRAI